MKLKDLKQDIETLIKRDTDFDVYFEDEQGKVHKVNSICVATRVAFKELGSDGQMQTLIK